MFANLMIGKVSDGLVQEHPDILAVKHILFKLVKTPKKLDKILKKLDADGTGGLSKQELRIFLASCCQKSGYDMTMATFNELWLSIEHHKTDTEEKIFTDTLGNWLFNNLGLELDKESKENRPIKSTFTKSKKFKNAFQIIVDFVKTQKNLVKIVNDLFQPNKPLENYELSKADLRTFVELCTQTSLDVELITDQLFDELWLSIEHHKTHHEEIANKTFHSWIFEPDSDEHPHIADVKKIIKNTVQTRTRLHTIIDALDKKNTHGLTKTELNTFILDNCKEAKFEVTEKMYNLLWLSIEHHKIMDHDEISSKCLEDWLFEPVQKLRITMLPGYAKRLPPLYVNNIRHAFSQYDTDNTLQMDVEELFKWMILSHKQRGGIKTSDSPTKEDALQLINKLDSDGDGILEYDELILWFKTGYSVWNKANQIQREAFSKSSSDPVRRAMRFLIQVVEWASEITDDEWLPPLHHINLRHQFDEHSQTKLMLDEKELLIWMIELFKRFNSKGDLPTLATARQIIQTHDDDKDKKMQYLELEKWIRSGSCLPQRERAAFANKSDVNRHSVAFLEHVVISTSETIQKKREKVELPKERIKTNRKVDMKRIEKLSKPNRNQFYKPGHKRKKRSRSPIVPINVTKTRAPTVSIPKAARFKPLVKQGPPLSSSDEEDEENEEVEKSPSPQRKKGKHRTADMDYISKLASPRATHTVDITNEGGEQKVGSRDTHTEASIQKEIKRLQKWNDMKNKNIQRRHEEKEELRKDHMFEHCTFKPKLNKYDWKEKVHLEGVPKYTRQNLSPPPTVTVGRYAPIPPPRRRREGQRNEKNKKAVQGYTKIYQQQKIAPPLPGRIRHKKSPQLPIRPSTRGQEYEYDEAIEMNQAPNLSDHKSIVVIDLEEDTLNRGRSTTRKKNTHQRDRSPNSPGFDFNIPSKSLQPTPHLEQQIEQNWKDIEEDEAAIAEVLMNNSPSSFLPKQSQQQPQQQQRQQQLQQQLQPQQLQQYPSQPKQQVQASRIATPPAIPPRQQRSHVKSQQFNSRASVVTPPVRPRGMSNGHSQQVQSSPSPRERRVRYADDVQPPTLPQRRSERKGTRSRTGPGPSQLAHQQQFQQHQQQQQHQQHQQHQPQQKIQQRQTRNEYYNEQYENIIEQVADTVSKAYEIDARQGEIDDETVNNNEYYDSQGESLTISLANKTDVRGPRGRVPPPLNEDERFDVILHRANRQARRSAREREAAEEELLRVEAEDIRLSTSITKAGEVMHTMTTNGDEKRNQNGILKNKSTKLKRYETTLANSLIDKRPPHRRPHDGLSKSRTKESIVHQHPVYRQKSTLKSSINASSSKASRARINKANFNIYGDLDPNAVTGRGTSSMPKLAKTGSFFMDHVENSNRRLERMVTEGWGRIELLQQLEFELLRNEFDSNFSSIETQMKQVRRTERDRKNVAIVQERKKRQARNAELYRQEHGARKQRKPPKKTLAHARNELSLLKQRGTGRMIDNESGGEELFRATDRRSKIYKEKERKKMMVTKRKQDLRKINKREGGLIM